VKRLLSITCFVLFCCAYSCGQNGPTPPSVVLTWTQSTGPGTITANCVYRGATAGNYTLPALFCSTTPITTYTDTTVTRGTTYNYAVTAKVGATEGGYSNNAAAAVPLAPAPPVLNVNVQAPPPPKGVAKEQQ
jgi:hypothetical protein